MDMAPVGEVRVRQRQFDLARAFSSTTIILNHAGGVLGVGRYSGHRQENPRKLAEGHQRTTPPERRDP
jgi:hypothetical protein